MHPFRSRLFSILIAALVLVGYSEVVRGACDDHEHASVQASEAGEPSHSHSQPDDQSCHCVCHQVFPNERSTPPALVGLLLEVGFVFPESAEIPPDAVPLGIDYPPQLA